MFLADAARVESGKLYVFGGTWDRISVLNLPATHPGLAVVVILQVDYDEALREHHGELALMKDGTLAGPTVQFTLNVGHSPGMTRGAATYIPLTFTHNLLELQEAGRYDWVLKLHDEPVRSHPMEVSRIPGPAGIGFLAPS